MPRPKIDVLMVGTGGQGIVLASDVLAQAALSEGYDVKKADTLGMSQRGGGVVSHVRLGERIFAPMIGKGGADILLAFEKLEAARWARYLRPGGLAIVNDQAIPPLPVSTGVEEYPTDDALREIILESTDRLFFVSGLEATQQLSDIRILNIFMLGFLSSFLTLRDEAWEQSISRLVPPKALSLNLRAFAQGRDEAHVVRRAT